MNMEAYLKENYKPGMPILLEEVRANTGDGQARQKMKRLCDAGKLRRYDKGIYYIPEMSRLGFEVPLNLYDVLKVKYLERKGEKIGYYSGYKAMNMAGLTSQNPAVLEITTNRATLATREVTIGGRKIILKKPPIEITPENAEALCALDIIKNINKYAESRGKEFAILFQRYLDRKGLAVEDLLKYADLYPDYIYKNLYKGGFLYGVKR